MKFRSKRSYGVIASLAIGTVGLTACAGGGSNNSDGSQTEEVRVMSWRLADTTSDLGKLHQAWIDEFNEGDSGFTAEGEGVPFADKGTKLVNDVLAGNPADVVALTTAELPDYAEYLLPITDRWQDEGYDDAYLPVAKELATWEGEVYGVPIENGSSDGLYYNTEVLEAAGVDIEDATTDWASFTEALTAITDSGNQGIVLRGKDPSTFDYNWTWFTAAGADFSDPAAFVENVCGPAGHDAFNFLVDLYAEEEVVASNPIEVAYDESFRIFADGKTGFNVDGPWGQAIYESTNPDIVGNLGVTLPPPMEAGNNTGVNVDSLIYVIPKDAKNPEGAWEYIKSATQAKNQEASAELGFLPTMADIQDTPGVTDNPILSEYATMIAENGFPRPRGPEMEKNKTALVQAYQAALAGSMSADDALDQACGQLQNNG